MISIKFPRSHVKFIQDYFFPYINLHKQTRLNNVANESLISETYLSAIVINCILDEIQQLFTKKLVNTTGSNIKFEFTDAQAIVLYKTLIHYPLQKDNVYLQMIRNQWIQILDLQLQKEQILIKTAAKIDAATTPWDFYEQ